MVQQFEQPKFISSDWFKNFYEIKSLKSTTKTFLSFNFKIICNRFTWCV